MSLAHPKPARRAPRPPSRLRRSPLARSQSRIKRKVMLGAKRRAAKAAGGVDPLTWLWICDFYRDSTGVVRCAYACWRPATQQDHVVPIARKGAHVAGNVVPACAACNEKKGTQTWEPARRHPFMERG